MLQHPPDAPVEPLRQSASSRSHANSDPDHNAMAIAQPPKAPSAARMPGCRPRTIRHHDDLAAGSHDRGEAGQHVLWKEGAWDQTFGQEPEAILQLDRVSWFVQVVQHRLEGAIRD